MSRLSDQIQKLIDPFPVHFLNLRAARELIAPPYTKLPTGNGYLLTDS